jgi:geranylgeranyl transferase type-2 subunit alpha
MDDPDWKTELYLINKILDVDSRNFHIWAYRRYVIHKSAINSPLQEFEYTTRKIYQNFSNYSAWHYRQKVFKEAFPESFETQLKNDLDLVRNAIYTEPADQSSWMHQKWLLGERAKVPQALKAICFHRADSTVLLVVFNIKLKLKASPILLVDQMETVAKFETMFKLLIVTFKRTKGAVQVFIGNEHIFSKAFVGVNISGEIAFDSISELGISNHENNSGLHMHHCASDNVWKNELNSIASLAELEPDSKWAILTLAKMYENLGQIDESQQMYEKLVLIDPYRVNYYRDEGIIYNSSQSTQDS